MHLTDEKLLELDEVSKQHLEKCTECNNRANVLLSMRQQLTLQPEMPDFEANWQDIKHSYQIQQKKTSEKKVIFWRFSALAFAAAFAVMAVLPLFNYDEVNDVFHADKVILAGWVEQNRLVQQQLHQQLNANFLSRVQFNQLQMQLTPIDMSLQKVYLLNKPTSEKIQLWQQRKQLIENSLIKRQQPYITSI
ncbi:MAG: hypothetical protein ACI9YH_000581 [Colwellia sp.]|jgi:hypothetical protein